MLATLWELPVASTALMRGPELKELSRRVYEIIFHIEADNGGEKEIRLSFNDVIAFKCTFLPALTVPMIENSYDKLVDLGETEWLAEGQRLADGWARGRPKLTYRHLQICVDDGPCYEFLCEGYRLSP